MPRVPVVVPLKMDFGEAVAATIMESEEIYAVLKEKGLRPESMELEDGNVYNDGRVVLTINADGRRVYIAGQIADVELDIAENEVVAYIDVRGVEVE